MGRFRLLLALSVAVLAAAPAASAHLIIVTPKGQGSGTVQWVGGGPLPAQAQGAGLIMTPFGFAIPAAHDRGLVHACLMAMRNETGAVTFMAPPFPPFSPENELHCVHGHSEAH